MKYCYQCGRINPGDPLFCNNCGRSFDRKLCPRLHPNSRSAEVCSRCGSRELSTPQPRVSFGWKILEWLGRFLIGIVLVFLVLLLAYEALLVLLGSPQGEGALLLLGGMVLVLFWIWGKLPEWLRKFVRNRLRRRRERHAED
jgi:RNA polymerase subunit RPABC4/transcription elongation factor Spt4